MANLTAPEIALPSPARVAAEDTRSVAAPVLINPSSWQEVLAVWVGRVVTAAAFWSLISIPLHGWNVAGWVDHAFWIVNIPVSPSLFTVVLLTLLGNALRRRLRFGLLVLVFFQALSAVIGVAAAAVAIAQTQHADVTVDVNNQPTAVLIVEGSLGLVLAVLLWRQRPNFPARLAPGSRVRALIVLLLGLAISALVSITLVQAFPHTLREGSERLVWALRIVVGLTPPDGSSAFHGHSGYHWITTVVGAISALALAGAAVVFLRSARLTRYLSAADELDVRRLLLESGERDSLGYFGTRRDKSVVFAPDRRAVISYRVVASVSLASGDPIGELSAWPDAITAWLAEARRFGWFPAALSASEAGARAYVRAGLRALSIGDEAVIHVDEFSLSDRAMAPVRKAVNRVRRAGYTVQVRRHGELSQPELAELAHRAEQWRGDETERGFSMALGRLGDETDQRCVMVTAHDAAGTTRGLLSFVPWGMRGLSLDLMRRDRNAENGITEFMVAGLVDASPDLGIRRISLNFAMFREVFQAAERVGAGPVLRLTNAMLSVASQFWQLESLYRSNAKYLPEWVPRFLCYDSSLTLTRTVIASGMAEGFLPAPYPAVRRHADDRVGERLFVDLATEQDERVVRPVVPRQRLTQQQRVRRAKIERLAAAGVAAYPVRVPRTVRAAELRARYRDLRPATATGHTGVAVTGRVRALRDFGGLCFAVVQDDGVPFQIMLARDRLGAERHQLWRHCIDLGDLVSVTGEVVTSRHGELSLLASDWTIAAKCLRPLPDLHSGFSDPDARFRQRYLDLIVNARAREVLQTRTLAVQQVRVHLSERGFVEVETPMLQAIHGGANARPFRTHINAYDMDLYLRIAPELYLKRLCVAGLERIFELNRNFRNEGADSTHNPEFTSLELYQAYADYHDMRALTRDLILHVATAVHGAPIVYRPAMDGERPRIVELDGEWPCVPVHQAVSRAAGADIAPDTDAATVRAVCDRLHVRAPAEASAGHLVLALYDELVEPHTVQPTFYMDFPVETSPLTRVHRRNPRLAERWDLVAFGTEIGTAYSELIDPIDQRQRLTEQSLLAANGDPEAMEVDEAFLTSLEYSMPPTGGLGIGVDRLIMMLTGTNIRSTLAFPFVRP